MKIVYSLLWSSLFLLVACQPKTKDTTSANPTKYEYQTVKGDPTNTKIYTLENGLKVYMSVNKDEPRIQTIVATRTGSRNDPADATGLAHYLEHMLFKGTSEIASLDWEKEQKILKQISDLYEEHRKAKPEDRKAIYTKIDSLSSIAATYVAANEYDKLVASLGAKGTNAFTSFDRTAYINDIPSNELEKWLRVESERFRELVLRLFHTELEAVYEEFNINQNRDGRKVMNAMLGGLLPNHPYGTQTTIGTGEHLKTPSMEKIHAYFDKYYVPNNMAIILAGDFNPDEAVALIEKYFGDYKKQPVEPKKVPAAEPMTETVVKEIVGQEASMLQVAWRLEGAGSKEAMMADLLSEVLYNGQAGLIDINLLQKQQVGQPCYAYIWDLREHSVFVLRGTPREGQKLEDLKDLLIQQLELVKKGEFPDWMIEAVVNNMEYRQILNAESNTGRAYKMLDAFINEIEWAKMQKYYDEMRKITKEELMAFAKKHLRKDNHVVVYKREGDPEIYEVDKPKITPVPVNREAKSTFRAEFDKLSTPRQKPLFLDFDESIQRKTLEKGVELEYIKNITNKTFELDYIFEMGSYHDRVLPIAIDYLPYLGTSKYSPEDLKKEFFKLGLSFDVYSSSEVCYVTLTGLERSLEEGIKLFEHILANVEPNKEALEKLVADIKKDRKDAKKNKRAILYGALSNYGRYGIDNPYTFRLSSEDLDKLTPERLIETIKNLHAYKHKVFYYGQKPIDELAKLINEHHKAPEKFKPYPPQKEFEEQPTDKDRVLFVNYDGMAQAEVLMMSKGTPKFSQEEYIWSRLYNEYFGGGLSSIVFQEIRESKALAYSAWATNSSPSKEDKAHYYMAYVGTQVDKLKDAIPAMREIIDDIPIVEEQLANAMESILKKIESERITKDNIYWTYRSAVRQGHGKDLRKKIYETYKKLSKDEMIENLKQFHKNNIKGRNYTFLVLADKEKVDLDYLKSLGEFEELSLEEVFGY